MPPAESKRHRVSTPSFLFVWVHSKNSGLGTRTRSRTVGAPNAVPTATRRELLVHSCATPSPSSLSQVRRPDPLAMRRFVSSNSLKMSKRLPIGKHLTRPAPQGLPTDLLVSLCFFFWNFAVFGVLVSRTGCGSPSQITTFEA